MKRIDLLDYARLFAAFCVLALHYTYSGITNGKVTSIGHIDSIIDITKYGYLGVEFFFMISGYVIFFSATNSSASKFIVSRAVRLYPLFVSV
jgi:peptidoglycan/LPS O-acetylase OafA/YrhL